MTSRESFCRLCYHETIDSTQRFTRLPVTFSIVTFDNTVHYFILQEISDMLLPT